jgi:tRNA (cytidine/uridine-2'-O-)-methyltransferase
MTNIVLVEPEIPFNTGAVARTCACTGSVLHLVKPLGFDISDSAVKRAGLDYWHLVDIRVYENLDDYFTKTATAVFGSRRQRHPADIMTAILR